MEPKIIEKDGFTVVGAKVRCTTEDTSKIPQLWGQLMARMGEIPNLVGDGNSYGVMDNYDEATESWDYIAAFEVSGDGNVPEGLVSLEIPAQTYAVFPCTMPTIQETYGTIYEQWLPQSEYEHAPTPEFERYPPTYNPEDEASQFEVYIPVTK